MLIFVGKYAINILIALDCLANALLLGDPRETICSRLGKVQARDDQTWLGKALCWALDTLDPDHVYKSIDPHEGDQELWSWGRSPPK